MPPRKSKKFFFDTHNFDEDEPEIIEEETPPPPPVFSEEEMEAARQDAFEKGRQQGLDEAAQSREKHVTALLETIKEEIPSLLAQEDRRIALYEREAVQLAEKMFAALFPALNDRHGLEEIRNMLATVLENQRRAPEIVIEVRPEYGEEIRAFIAALGEDNNLDGFCVVREKETLGPGDCRLSWKDGGAERDIGAVKQEMEKHFQQILAGNAPMTDNEQKTARIPQTETTEQNPAKSRKEPIPTKNDGEQT